MLVRIEGPLPGDVDDDDQSGGVVVVVVVVR